MGGVLLTGKVPRPSCPDQSRTNHARRILAWAECFSLARCQDLHAQTSREQTMHAEFWHGRSASHWQGAKTFMPRPVANKPCTPNSGMGGVLLTGKVPRPSCPDQSRTNHARRILAWAECFSLARCQDLHAQTSRE